MRPSEVGMPGLADQLNELFRTVRRPGTTELWNNETAAWEISQGGLPVSAAYLSQLRTGKRFNPSARHLAALAGMFGVPMEYFFLSADWPRRQARGGKLPSPIAAARVLTLLDGVSAAGVARIEQMITGIRAVEELPPVPPGSAAEFTDTLPSGATNTAAGPRAEAGKNRL